MGLVIIAMLQCDPPGFSGLCRIAGHAASRDNINSIWITADRQEISRENSEDTGGQIPVFY